MLALLPSLSASVYWPFIVLLVGILCVVGLITILRVHAFIALIVSSLVVGFLSPGLPVGPGSNTFVSAIEMTMNEFGSTAGKIAWVIALAAVIGVCLMESGAADRIVRTLVRLFGEKRAGLAFLLSGFLLSIPVFFDTVFFLLIPLAQALAFRLGKQYLYFVLAICSGAVVTHILVPPTPGPLVMAAELKIDLGLAIVSGIALGIIPALVALRFARWMDGRMNIPVRESPGIKLADLRSIVEKPDAELPSLIASLLPVALPVALIALTSLVSLGLSHGALYDALLVIGNKNIAMLGGAALALGLLARQKGLSLKALGPVVEGPLGMAGTIILITAGGGAFGAMIRHSGIGNSIAALTADSGVSMLLVAWLVACVLKIAQGSGTVSMMATVAIMVAVIGESADLGCSRIYLLAAIAFGSQVGVWMNDSGFWVVCKMSGFTEKETLQSFSTTTAVIGIVGLMEVFICSSLWPFPFGH